MKDPSYLSEVAQWLRHPDGHAHYVKMMKANPTFQDEARDAAEALKKDGILPNFLRLEYYAQLPLVSDKDKKMFEAILSQARKPNTAFNSPVVGKSRR